MLVVCFARLNKSRNNGGLGVQYTKAKTPVFHWSGAQKAEMQPDKGMPTTRKTLSQFTWRGQFHAVMRVSVTCGCAAMVGVDAVVLLPEKGNETVVDE